MSNYINPPTTTYADRAKADASDEHEGRFAGAQSKPTVIGRTEGGGPLPAPLWCQQQSMVPDEPPLGEDVNWLPSMETASGLPREEAEPSSLTDMLTQAQALQTELDRLLTQINEVQTEEGSAE
jgi:hypothetical protein